MIISTTTSDATAKCPECKKIVDCDLVSGNMAYHPMNIRFYHRDCGTSWTRWVDQGRSEITARDNKLESSNDQ
jgi:hypothetical protein